MISIQNIYYMLAYAFRILRENGYQRIAAEHFENAADILSAILIQGVSVQLKRGMEKTYISKEEATSFPRGKIQLTKSIKKQAAHKKQLVCNYDNFSVNSYHNRILKTTMSLFQKSNIPRTRKQELRKLLAFFTEVDIINPYLIDWNFQFNRNNQTYQMLLSVCWLSVNGLLQTDIDGKMKMMDFLDEQSMARLYEKFILNYFKREYPWLQVSSPQISWQLDDPYDAMLPIMQTDIVLSCTATKQTLIIDAKYYAHNTQTRMSSARRTIISEHLYQIYAYVKNWKTSSDESVGGMILYAKTDDEIQPDNEYKMDGNLIQIKTLNLNADFSEITEQLNEIAEFLRTE